jgi:hypothetical protein
MSQRKRKCFFWLFKALSVIVSCAFPVWAICEKFPIWKAKTGVWHSIGIGAILILIVVAIIARKPVFDFCRDRLKLQHAPPIMVWVGCLIASYILIYIGNFMTDLNIVIWMGLAGCGIGNVLTFISNRFAVEEKTDE